MKFAKSFCAVLLLSTATAGAQVTGFTNVVNSAIPDANPTGLTSTKTVSGVSGAINDVSVYLDISGGFNGDLYAYLSFDGGGFAVLLNRVGKSAVNPTGYGDPGMNILLDDNATTDVHLYGGNAGSVLTGSWQPDGRNFDPQLVLDTDPRTAMLSSFHNLSPNGTWTLFVADMATGFNSSLVQWGLTFQSVPEPSVAALGAVGFLLLGAPRFFRRVRR